MNDLIVKKVDFYGDEILATKYNGKIYVGIAYVCNGIGLSKAQKDTQVQNIQNDYVLKQGCLKFQAGVFDKNNETIAIDLDFLPLWLAKISITPKMLKHNLKLADKLAEYQLKAKDVLAREFLVNEKFSIPQTYSEALKLASTFAEQAEKYQLLMSTTNAKDMDEVVNILKIPKFGRTKMFRWLRHQGILMDGVRKNIPYSTYSKYFEVIEIIKGNKSFSKTLVKPEGINFILKRIEKEKRLLEAAN